MNEMELEAAVKAEQICWRHESPVQFRIPKMELLCLISAVQLAARHPGWGRSHPSRQVAEAVIRQLAAHAFRDDDPATFALVECGWDRRYDTPAAEAPLAAHTAPASVGVCIPDDRFNELLNGPLNHPMPMFSITRLAMALRAVVDATGKAGWDALEAHCREREEKDEQG